MSVITLRWNPEYTLRGEFLWFGVILHCDVHVTWTKGVKERLKDDIQAVVKGSTRPVYAFQTPSHDPKKRKFIKSLGGKLDHYRTTPDGERAEMYRFLALD